MSDSYVEDQEKNDNSDCDNKNITSESIPHQVPLLKVDETQSQKTDNSIPKLKEYTEQSEKNAAKEARPRSFSNNSIPEIILPEEKKTIADENLVKNSSTCGDLLFSIHSLISGNKSIPTSSFVEGKSVMVDIPILFSIVHDAQPILKEFLFELEHVSECSSPSFQCNYKWCPYVKKDIFHASICTDTGCSQCLMLRPLLLVHSIQCSQNRCSLPFCDQYRNAWSVFVMNMCGCPAPDFVGLMSMAINGLLTSDKRLNNPLFPSGVHSTCPSDSNDHFVNITKNQIPLKLSVFSELPPSDTYPDPTPVMISPVPPMSEASPPPLMSPISPQPTISSHLPPDSLLSSSTSPIQSDPIRNDQSSLLHHTTPPHPSMSPLMMMQLSGDESDGCMPRSPMMDVYNGGSRKRDSIISTHYIECRKCKKKRAIPISLDESMLPNFECSMNIWDSLFSHCSIPENNVANYTICLIGRSPQYLREQSEFMFRLKMFIKNKNVGSFKQPMLGKREVDLYRLFREVTAHGGCENVIKKEGTWSRIYRGMDNYSPTETSASYRLKKIYTKYLIDYERDVFNFKSPVNHNTDYPFNSLVETRQPTVTTSLSYNDNYDRSSKSPIPIYSNTQWKGYQVNNNLNRIKRSTPISTRDSQSDNVSPSIQQIPQIGTERMTTSGQMIQSINQNGRYYSLPILNTIQNVPMSQVQQYQQIPTGQKMYYEMMGDDVTYSPVQMQIQQKGYEQYESDAKRYRPSVATNTQQRINSTEGNGYHSERVSSRDDGLQTLLSLRRSVSPVPQTDTNGKWESLMSAAAESAKQQKGGNGNQGIRI